MLRVWIRAIALLLLVCVLTSDAAAPAKVKPAGAAGAPPTKPATQPHGSKPKVNSGKPEVVKPVVKPGAKPVAKPAAKPEVGHAKTNATTNAATAAIPPPKSCKYDAKDTVGFTGRIFVKGGMFMPDSVYAVCTNGKHLCYAADDTSDGQQGPPVKCPPKDATKLKPKPPAPSSTKRELSVHMTGEHTWPHGVVCHTIDPSFPDDERDNMIESWASFEPLGFKLIDFKTECKATAKEIGKPICNNCRVTLRVVPDDDDALCETTVGYSIDHDRTMKLGSSCRRFSTSYRTYVHEMGHALGLVHEHQHPDIPFIIARDRIPKGVEANYARTPADSVGMTLTTYDPQSIMHYSGEFKEFCKPAPEFQDTVWCDVFEDEGTNGCVIPLSSHCSGGPLNFIRTDLSEGDKAALTALYWPDGDAPQPPQFSDDEAVSDGEGEDGFI